MDMRPFLDFFPKDASEITLIF